MKTYKMFQNLININSTNLLVKFKIYNLFTINLCFAHFLFYVWNRMFDALFFAIIFLISLVFFYFKIQYYFKYYFYLLLITSQCILGLLFSYHESNGIYFLLIPVYLGVHLILNTTSLRKIIIFNLLLFFELLFNKYCCYFFEFKCDKYKIPYFFELNLLTLFAFCSFFWVLFFQKFELALFFKTQKQKQFLFINFKEKLKNKDNLKYLEDLRIQSPHLFVKVFFELFHELEELINENDLILNFAERLLLAYCLLGFSYKDIALYTNSSLKSVESRKYRLKKKLEQANLLFILNL